MSFCVLGCNNDVKELIISDKPFLVNKEIEFNYPKLFERKCNTGVISIDLDVEWHPFPPWTEIELENGEKIKISVMLTSENNQIYQSKLLGMTNGLLSVRFDPEIPKGEKINKIKILTNAPLKCNKISWVDYNAY
jgi:hypothetical protein